MATTDFPELNPADIAGTRSAIHSYSQVLGDWLKSCRTKRKHWWHASLRPSMSGIGTGVIHADTDFELNISLRDNMLQGRTVDGAELFEDLHGQPAGEVAQLVDVFLMNNGISDRNVPDRRKFDNGNYPDYSAEHAFNIGLALNSVSAAFEEFRAGIREETSPIQLWPHHFDLSMLWLPGELIAGQDPRDEEYSDKQMNFGFALGDEAVPEPYFYITAYPLPAALPDVRLPAGASWRSEGFSGGVVLYRSLIQNADPTGYLLDIWNALLAAGREHMLEHPINGQSS